MINVDLIKLRLSTDVTFSNVHFSIFTHLEGKRRIEVSCNKNLVERLKDVEDVLSFIHRKKHFFQHDHLVTS